MLQQALLLLAETLVLKRTIVLQYFSPDSMLHSLYSTVNWLFHT